MPLNSLLASGVVGVDSTACLAHLGNLPCRSARLGCRDSPFAASNVKSLASTSFSPRKHFRQLESPLVQRVPREIWGHLHLELRPTVVLVADQEIRAAADVESQPLSCLQQDWLRCQAKF
jgi:hypothetical protein